MSLAAETKLELNKNYGKSAGRYTVGERIRATSATSTGTITAASRTRVAWVWDHDTSETWEGTPKELAELAIVTADAPSEHAAHVRKILGL